MPRCLPVTELLLQWVPPPPEVNQGRGGGLWAGGRVSFQRHCLLVAELPVSELKKLEATLADPSASFLTLCQAPPPLCCKDKTSGSCCASLVMVKDELGLGLCLLREGQERILAELVTVLCLGVLSEELQQNCQPGNAESGVSSLPCSVEPPHLNSHPGPPRCSQVGCPGQGPLPG